jgi:hypothetical protein
VQPEPNYNLAQGTLDLFASLFLPAFKTAFKQSIIKENIKAGFRGTGLVLHNLQAMLSKLNIVV